MASKSSSAASTKLPAPTSEATTRRRTALVGTSAGARRIAYFRQMPVNCAIGASARITAARVHV